MGKQETLQGLEKRAPDGVGISGREHGLRDEDVQGRGPVEGRVCLDFRREYPHSHAGLGRARVGETHKPRRVSRLGGSPGLTWLAQLHSGKSPYLGD